MPVRTPTPRRSPQGPSRATAASNLVSGMVGGLVVLALGATLVGTGVLNTGDTHTEIIRQLATPATTLASADGKSRSVADIYRATASGVVFVSARISLQTDSPFGAP